MSVPIAVTGWIPKIRISSGRHQRGAAHAGHADQQADAKSECDDRGIHDAEQWKVCDQGRLPGVPADRGSACRPSRPNQSGIGRAMVAGSGCSAHDVVACRSHASPRPRGRRAAPRPPAAARRAASSARVTFSSTARRFWRTATQTSRRRSAGADVVRLLGRQVLDVRQRPLDGADHVGDRDLRRILGEPVAAARAALRPGSGRRASARGGCARGTAAGSPAPRPASSP